MARKPKTDLEKAQARIAELEETVAELRATGLFIEPEGDEIIPVVLDQPRSVDPTQYGPAILQALERAAFADVGEVISFGSQGGVRVKPSEDWPVELRRLITEVKEDKDGNVLIKFVSKDMALRLLGQASGVIKDAPTITNNLQVNLLDVLKAVDGKTRGLPPKNGHYTNGNGHG